MLRHLILLGAAAAVLTAGTVSGPFTSVSISGGSNSSGVGLTQTLTNSPFNGYVVTATACFDGYCPGQPGGSGPIFPVNDPLTVRLTAFTATCTTTAAATCGAIDIFGGFTWLSTTTAQPNVTFSIDGTAPANFTFQASGAAESPSITTGLIPVVTNAQGTFNQSIGIGSVSWINGSQAKANIRISINGLVSGGTISMPGSANIIFGASPAPEPTTVAVVGGGLAALAFLVRRKRTQV